MSGRPFWPPAEAAQADYERLRAYVLAHDRWPTDLAAVRFARRGLAGLIAWPLAEPTFIAELVAVPRPRWSPYHDPRTEVLAAAYQLLVEAAEMPTIPASRKARR
jgi:hypothetical protein